MNDAQESLKSWIMENFCTQGFNMDFEELTSDQLETLEMRVITAKNATLRQEQRIAGNSEKREDLEAQIQHLQSELDQIS